MCAEKDSFLAEGALVSDKKTCTHEKPMVSLQNDEEIITILLFFTFATIINNFEFSLILLQQMLQKIANALSAIVKCWRLKRMWHAVRTRLMWILRVILFWLHGTALIQVVMLSNECCWSLFRAQVIQLFKVLPNYPRVFDSTLGYPGEGWTTARKRKRNRKNKHKWSTEFANLNMATWNTRSMTIERFDYCKRMVYDVLAVSELWRTQEKFTSRSYEFTTSATVKDKDGNLVNDNDPAAGVGILLSPRAQQKVLDVGNNNSERICWVRLKGPACNLFIVAVYMPHASRVQPAQADTLGELDVICKQAKPGDCLVVMGDLNVQLPSCVQGCTGKYVCAQGESPEANEVINYQLHEKS